MDEPREVSPDSLRKLSNKELLVLHSTLHRKYDQVLEEGSAIEDIANAHQLVFEEMKRRDLRHPRLPGKLDGVFKDDQKDDESDIDYAPVYGSGSIQGSEIFLEEVLQHFKSFRARSPVAYLVGGLPERGSTVGDIDILLRGKLTPELRHVLQFRIGRMFPPELSQRIQFLDDEYDGPFTNYVPLADLVVQMRPEFAVKQMCEVEKQNDIFQEYPSLGSHRSVVQLHFRGKSTHFDFRVDVGDHLIGWTFASQRPGKVPDVDTLQQAREIISGYSIEDGNEYLKPMQAPSHLYASGKAAQPKSWLDMDGIVEPGGVGATRNEAGLFLIVDRPRVEFGFQEGQFHEYFLTGSRIGWNGILFLRQIDRAGLKLPDEPSPTRLMWLGAFKKNYLPYILSTRAVRLRRMPPPGQSALPSSLMQQVPEEFRYWEEKGAKAREVRDALVKERIFTERTVNLVGGKIVATKVKYEPIESVVRGTEMIEAASPRLKFRLLKTVFKGQQVVRTGPTSVRYDLLIEGGPCFIFEGDDPRTTDQRPCLKVEFSDQIWDAEGEQQPGTVLNPTKETFAFTTREDDGFAVVEEEGATGIRIFYNGDDFHGQRWFVKEQGSNIYTYGKEVELIKAITTGALGSSALPPARLSGSSIKKPKELPEWLLQLLPKVREKIQAGQRVILSPVSLDEKEYLLADSESKLTFGIATLKNRLTVPSNVARYYSKLLDLSTDDIEKSWPGVDPFYIYDIERFSSIEQKSVALVDDSFCSRVEVRKIEDVDSYNAREVSDAVLRDDFRIALAWYSTLREDPRSFMYTREQVVGLLVKIIRELISRKAANFSPSTMKPMAREGFEEAVRVGNIDIPDGMKKNIQIWNIEEKDSKRDRTEIQPLAIFQPMKPSEGSHEFRDVDALVAEFASPEALGLGIAVEPKWNGLRIVLERDEAGETLIYFEDTKRDRSEVLPRIAAALKKYPRPVILDGEILLKNPDGSFARRAELTQFSGATGAKDDSNVLIQAFGILYDGNRELVDSHYDDMRIVLGRVVERLPSKHFSLTPSRICHSKESLLEAIEWAKKQPASEGAMLKLTHSTYSLGGETDSWAKFKSEREIVAVVLEKIRKEPSPSQSSPSRTWVYRCGIPLTKEEWDRWTGDKVEVDEQKFADVGKTFGSNLEAEAGDHIKVGVTEMLIKGDPPVSIKWFTPTPIDKVQQPSDTPKTLLAIAQPQEIVKEYIDISVLKADDEEHVVGGIVLKPGMTDLQGDIYSQDSVRRAAHFFMENYLTSKQHGIRLMHKGSIIHNAARVIQSFIVERDTVYEVEAPRVSPKHSAKSRKAVTVPVGTWVMYVRILDDTLWKSIKDGEYTGFSIGGMARVLDLKTAPELQLDV